MTSSAKVETTRRWLTRSTVFTGVLALILIFFGGAIGQYLWATSNQAEVYTNLDWRLFGTGIRVAYVFIALGAAWLFLFGLR